MINVTVPTVTSNAEGVYVAASKVESSNVPVPDEDHKIVKAPPPTEPANVTTLPSQIV